MEQVKIILDTDIGTDIDDAIALGYLLKKNGCSLEGITTVTGEPDKRAMLADALCKVAGREIPIHCGCAEPMSNIPQRQKRASHATKLGNYEYRCEFETDTAVEFLKAKIIENPGEIVLLTIGPLTNIGRLFSENPEIPGLLKAHYMMGGAFHENSHENEWNILCDPDAAATVFANPAKVMRIFGLNVTRQVTMNADKVREKFNSVILRPILDFAEVFFKEQRDFITFHDPLAAVSIFEPEVCEMQRGSITVETEPGERFGATFWTPDANGEIEIAVTVKADEFFNELFTTTL